MGKSSTKSIADKAKDASTIKILMVDDDANIINSIKEEANKKENIKITAFKKISEAVDEVEVNKGGFEVVIVDFNMPGQRGVESVTDGVGLLKYLLPICSSKPKIKIIYTSVPEQISESEMKWCKEAEIIVLKKQTNQNHQMLFSEIENYFKPQYLPTNPNFAFMSNRDLLLEISKDLVEELKLKSEDYFSFGGNDEPLKNAILIEEILKLTPLGKEIIGNWLVGVKSNLKYLHNKQLKNKK